MQAAAGGGMSADTIVSQVDIAVVTVESEALDPDWHSRRNRYMSDCDGGSNRRSTLIVCNHAHIRIRILHRWTGSKKTIMAVSISIGFVDAVKVQISRGAATIDGDDGGSGGTTIGLVDEK
jgi:hypothetical protein